MRHVLQSCVLFWALMAPAAFAEVVWHCSRSAGPEFEQETQLVPKDTFTLAGLGDLQGVIEISLSDLINVFSGVSVKLGSLPLSACFKPVNDPETVQAMQALGLNVESFSALARKSAIVKSHLYRVTDEAEMKACIGRHHPAVGYLKEAVTLDRLSPCF